MLTRNLFFDDLFDDFRKNKAINLKTDIYKQDNNYIIEMEVPGLKKEDINITVESGYLTITIEKNGEDDEKTFVKRERFFEKSKRQFYIGNTNEDEINAKVEDGMLKITIPKQEENISKKQIEIN